MALTAREAGERFGRSAKMWWCDEYEDWWSGVKGREDQSYNVAELYGREAIKATQQLYELIQPSDGTLELPINWRYIVMPGPPFLRLL